MVPPVIGPLLSVLPFVPEPVAPAMLALPDVPVPVVPVPGEPVPGLPVVPAGEPVLLPIGVITTLFAGNFPSALPGLIFCPGFDALSDPF